jgi:hypothetical protein
LKGAHGTKPARGDRTIPYFTDSFSFDGVTYPYTMVGGNPRTSKGTTTIATEIVPIRVVFADGTVLDGTPRVAAVKASPIFTQATFDSGTTQYGDAMRRAEFWTDVSANGGRYHVLLGRPTILPTWTIHVPKGLGTTAISAGIRYGLIDYDWFAKIILKAPGKMHLKPSTLPIFLSDAVYLQDSLGCCVTGFHDVTPYDPAGVGTKAVHTMIWASWKYPALMGLDANDIRWPLSPGLLPAAGDIDTLSHEISEWYDDPFITNQTPNWSSPVTVSWYGCDSYLEVGDPLINVAWTVNGYHLQDEAFISWFAHDVPSRGFAGRYSYLNTLSGPATSC